VLRPDFPPIYLWRKYVNEEILARMCLSSNRSVGMIDRTVTLAASFLNQRTHYPLLEFTLHVVVCTRNRFGEAAYECQCLTTAVL
jgi:hypothetical protein